MAKDLAAHARRFERLANAPMDVATLPDRLLEALARLVPFDLFCWGAVDPESLLPTRTSGTTIPHTTPLVWDVHELVARGVVPHDLRSFAGSGGHVARVPEIVDRGDEQVSDYRRVLRPNGLDHQLRAALAVDGTQWGLLHIEREYPDFTESEVALVDALVPQFAHAFRRWILAEARGATDARAPMTPGVIVLDQDNKVDSISPEAEHWLGEWGVADLEIPPSAIAAVVGVARALVGRSRAEIIPSARVRLPTGAWLHVRAARLIRADRKLQTAVVLERAGDVQVAPLIARAHQLSQRETQIVLLVLRGLSTSEIAASLFISAYTVQDHLKSIFDKVGVHNRRELATDIFGPHLQAA
jgi:DNA-binding CsgD family transcriptional regulator